MAINPGDIGKMAEQIGPILRTLGDVKALTGAMGGGGGGGGGQHAPFGIGQESQGGSKGGFGGVVGDIANVATAGMRGDPFTLMAAPATIPYSIASKTARAAYDKTIGSAVGMATDVASVGLQFAGSKEQQMVGQDMLQSGNRILDKGVAAITNPASPKAWAELGAEIVNIIPTIERWGKALLGNVDQMAKFDANFAKASAKLQVGEYRRTIETAGATGESALNLAESLEPLMEMLRPIKDAVAIILNDIGAVLADVAVTMLEILTTLYEWMKAFLTTTAEVLKQLWVPFAEEMGVALESGLGYLNRIEKAVSDPKPAQDTASMNLLANARAQVAAVPRVADGIPQSPMARGARPATTYGGTLGTSGAG